MFWFPRRDFFFLFLLREGKLYDLSSVGCFISLGWSKAEHISTAHIHCKCRTCHKLIFQSLHNPVFLLTGLLNARSLHRKNKLSFKKEKKKLFWIAIISFSFQGGECLGGFFLAIFSKAVLSYRLGEALTKPEMIHIPCCLQRSHMASGVQTRGTQTCS